MLEIWTVVLQLCMIALGGGLILNILAFFYGIWQHINGYKFKFDIEMVWFGVGLILASVIAFGLIISTCLYFKQSWEHINQEHNVSHLSLYNCRIDSGSVRVESSKHGFYADFTGVEEQIQVEGIELPATTWAEDDK